MNSPRRLLNQQQVKNQFDRAAATYDSVAGLQRQMGGALLHQLSELRLAKEVRLIDLGCGTGELLSQLVDDGYTSLTGLDLSSAMIEQAKRKASSAAFLHAPIESIPVADNAFEVVVSNAAIQWCEPDVAASEIARILKPDGRLLLNSFVKGTLRQWAEAFEACGVTSRVHPLATAEDTRIAFKEAGLEIKKFEECTETSTFDSVDSMFASIRKLGATNATASRKQPISRREYLAIRQHFQLQLDTQGKLELDFVWAKLIV